MLIFFIAIAAKRIYEKLVVLFLVWPLLIENLAHVKSQKTRSNKFTMNAYILYCYHATARQIYEMRSLLFLV